MEEVQVREFVEVAAPTADEAADPVITGASFGAIGAAITGAAKKEEPKKALLPLLIPVAVVAAGVFAIVSLLKGSKKKSKGDATDGTTYKASPLVAATEETVTVSGADAIKSVVAAADRYVPASPGSDAFHDATWELTADDDDDAPSGISGAKPGEGAMVARILGNSAASAEVAEDAEEGKAEEAEEGENAEEAEKGEGEGEEGEKEDEDEEEEEEEEEEGEAMVSSLLQKARDASSNHPSLLSPILSCRQSLSPIFSCLQP
ncbi:unnamed protein product [Closterium sp. Naga37s-1]|nr:unnamed protein product [Closterium sp. Naga37s-1]